MRTFLLKYLGRWVGTPIKVWSRFRPVLICPLPPTRKLRNYFNNCRLYLAQMFSFIPTGPIIRHSFAAEGPKSTVCRRHLAATTITWGFGLDSHAPLSRVLPFFAVAHKENKNKQTIQYKCMHCSQLQPSLARLLISDLLLYMR